MKNYERYPLNLTQFKTSNYKPGDHFRIPLRWDNFTHNIPLWDQVLNHYFKDGKQLKFLELGSGNGLCANYLLDNFDCFLDTVDLGETRIEDNYEVSTLKNLKPFLSKNKCKFHNMSTRDFLVKNYNKKYDFIYVDASHDTDWVLYDAVNAFPLLKNQGLMIFDDYGMQGCKKGVDSFTSCFSNYIEIFSVGWQLMLHKVRDFKTEYD